MGQLKKKQVEFPGVFKKKSCGISMGFGCYLEFLRGAGVTQFCRISEGEINLVFTGISKGIK